VPPRPILNVLACIHLVGLTGFDMVPLLFRGSHTVHSDVKYSCVGRLHSDRWKKHPDYPDATKRPFLIMHKVVRFYAAFVQDRTFSVQVRLWHAARMALTHLHPREQVSCR
jgi:hypothetical protein